MGLKNLTKNIYFLPHEPEVDRPMLAYVKGDKFSLAVDAGYSKKHVQDFYRALRSCDLKEPDFTVITHWHYDHTFGLHDISGVSIAHQKTNLFLREQQDRANDKKYIDILKKDDTHFAKDDFRSQIPRFNSENLNHNYILIEYIQKLAQEKQVSPAQIALGWLLAQKPWIVPIPGTKKVSRLQENINSINVKFSAEELSMINKHLNSINLQGARYPQSQENLIDK